MQSEANQSFDGQSGALLQQAVGGISPRASSCSNCTATGCER